MASNTTLLCIGAGAEQLAAIELGQRMGHHVVALDGNPQSPGLSVADQGIVVDLRDEQEVIQIARETDASCVIPVPLGAVLTTVGAVNDAMGWRGISHKAALACTDKTVMREALSRGGFVIQPKYRNVHSITAAREAAYEIGLPVILKPARGSGSRGVSLISTHAELNSILAEAEAQGQFELIGGLLIEAAILGYEVGIDAVVTSGHCIVLSVRKKKISPPPQRVTLEYTGPIELDAVELARVQSTIESAVLALKLDDCMLHADLMIDPIHSLVSLIEISGRPSGFGLSLEMLPACLGFNPIEQMIRLMLGQSFSFTPRLSRVARLRGLFDYPGRLRAIGDLDEARKLPGVLSINLPLRVGDEVPSPHSAANWWRAGLAMFVANDLQALDDLWVRIQDVLQLQVE